jgi:hypothetical protein
MRTEEALIKLSFAMDAMEAYEANEDTIFDNEADAQKFRYDPKYFKSLSWGNNNLCIYKGCKEQAIRASHTIQKSTSLSSIAENRHVLAPRFNYRQEDYNLASIGVNEASTFPGFCTTHEQIFSKFEDKKILVDEQDFRLQIYRTICREIMENRRSLASSVYRKDDGSITCDEPFFKDIDTTLNLNDSRIKRNRKDVLTGAINGLNMLHNHKGVVWNKTNIQKLITEYSALDKEGKYREYCQIVVFYLRKKLIKAA